MADLILKYRIIWDTYTKYIQNNYELDYSGSLTKIVNNGDLDYLESDVYQDILDKIQEEWLLYPPDIHDIPSPPNI